VPLIDPARRIVLTAAPGTASTSLAAAFSVAGGVLAVPEHDLTDGRGRQVLDAKHATVAEVVAAGLLPADHGCRIVTSTRNPFDFYVAEWIRTRTRWVAELRDPTSWVHRQPGALDRLADALEHDFEGWLALTLEPHLSGSRTRTLNAGHVDEADVVLRMEKLEEDAEHVGLALAALPRLNHSGRAEPYWVHYSSTARRQVEQVHGPDLARFGYAF
jgi:hypothetical protein